MTTNDDHSADKRPPPEKPYVNQAMLDVARRLNEFADQLLKGGWRGLIRDEPERKDDDDELRTD